MFCIVWYIVGFEIEEILVEKVYWYKVYVYVCGRSVIYFKVCNLSLLRNRIKIVIFVYVYNKC